MPTSVEMDASEPKWVNSDYIYNGVNSLRLEGLDKAWYNFNFIADQGSGQTTDDEHKGRKSRMHQEPIREPQREKSRI